MKQRPARPSDAAVVEPAPHLLKQRDFAIYWWSGIASGTGTWLHNVTASVLMLTLTGSPFMVGLVNFATFIPVLAFSLPAGSLGDRLDRRWVVGLAQGCAGLVAVILTLLTAAGLVRPWSLLVACSLIGTAAAVAKPSMSAMLVSLVPRRDVARATALNVLQFQFGQIVGPALASLILLLGSPAWGFGINAVSFLAPVTAMTLIHLRPTAPTHLPADTAPRRKGQIRKGLRFILGSSEMPAILLAVVLSNAAVEAIRTLAPTLAAHLDRPAAAGVVIMGSSGGALLGLICFGRFERSIPRRWVLVLAFGLQAVGAACVAISPSLPLVVLAAAPIGIGFSLNVPLLSAALQVLSPDDYRSRVMAVYSMAHLGMRPLFALVAGALASAVDARFAIACFGVLAAAAMVFVHRRRLAES